MRRSLLQYVRGYLKLGISGASAERFLNICRSRGIFLWGIRPCGEAYEFCLDAEDFRKLKPVIKKTGASVKIIEKSGLPFLAFRLWKRKAFLAGALFGLSLLYLLSFFVWDIRVEGNRAYTDEAILAFLEGKGVREGMSVAEVDCGRIVKDLRKSWDGVVWASASVSGCRLTIRIRENEDDPGTTAGEETAADGGEDTGDEAAAGGESSAGDLAAAGTDLVAAKAGVITDMIVRRGLPAVRIGDAVKEGQLLVSGAVPVTDDGGAVTGYQIQQADADIRARVKLEYSDSVRNVTQTREWTGMEKEELFLRIGNRMLWIGDHRIPWDTAASVTRERRLSVPGGPKLPVTIGSRMIREYKNKEKKYTKSQLRQLLSEKYRRFQEDLVKKGVEIIENDVKIYRGPVRTAAKGTLTVAEEIGREEPAEIPQDSISEDTTDGND